MLETFFFFMILVHADLIASQNWCRCVNCTFMLQIAHSSTHAKATLLDLDLVTVKAIEVHWTHCQWIHGADAKFRPCHLQKATDIDIPHTRRCYSNPQLSGFCESVPCIASDCSSWLTEMKPKVVTDHLPQGLTWRAFCYAFLLTTVVQSGYLSYCINITWSQECYCSKYQHSYVMLLWYLDYKILSFWMLH